MIRPEKTILRLYTISHRNKSLVDKKKRCISTSVESARREFNELNHGKLLKDWKRIALRGENLKRKKKIFFFFSHYTLQAGQHIRYSIWDISDKFFTCLVLNLPKRSLSVEEKFDYIFSSPRCSIILYARYMQKKTLLLRERETGHERRARGKLTS